MEQLALPVRLRDWARFAAFVAGRNAAAVSTLADAPRTASRVVWLWGRPGTGKTHLLQSACAAAGAAGSTAAYFDLSERIEAARLEGCETLPLVCLDSLENVADDAAWNAAVFRLHTLMHDLGGRLVVATRAAPASIEFRLPDLRSRLLAADVWQLHELDEPEQVRALQIRAARRGLELTDEAALFLVRRLPRDMHSLCDVLDRLDVASLVAQRRLTVPFLREALTAQAGEPPPPSGA
jgi:DnaA family protein